MNTKIGTSFGLALFLAIGVIATMVALGMFGPQKASADVPVTALVNSPTAAGEAAQITITFTASLELTAPFDLIVRFDKNFTVPDTIDATKVSLAASGSGVSNPEFDITARTNSSDAIGDRELVMRFQDTFPGTGAEADFDALAATNGHTLTFSGTAGILNPTSSSTTAHLVSLSDDNGATYDAAISISTSRSLDLSATSGARGKALTATGKGFSSTGSATLFIDTNDNGDIDTGEYIIASGISVSGGGFTQDFTTDTNFTGTQQINAIDGSGTAVSTTTNPTFATTGLVTADKTSAARGEAVKVSLAQYTAAAVVTGVKFGGVEAASSLAASLRTIATAGTLSMSLTVPTTTPLGTQQIVVAGGGEAASRSTTIEITGAPVTVSPTTAVAQQSITVSGSGFTPGGAATVAANSITVGGTAATHAELTVDNSGNIVVSFKIPDSTATQTAQTTKVRIEDSGGRLGEADLVIAARTLTLGEESSKRGTVIDVDGTGYEASSSITLTYTSGGTDHAAGNATADSAGAWSTTFTVPTATTVGIPSTNTFKAAFTSKTATTAVAKTVVHKVPGASIEIDPTSAKSGDTITLTGSNFPTFASVSTLTIGGIDARPVPAPATDTNGTFTASVLVPGATAGTQTVLVTAGGVTANTPLTLEAAAATTTTTTNATEDVFADVIDNDDNLVRVWRFNNADQTWAFYDPRPAFSSANTLTDASSGDIVWVNVTTEQDFQGQTLFPGWNLISLN